MNDGSVHWNSTLVAAVEEFDRELDRGTFNSKINALIHQEGVVKKGNLNPERAKANPALKWIFASISLGQENKDLFISLVNQYNKQGSYYAQPEEGRSAISFANEHGYKEMLFPAKEYRLLALFRGWNAVNYFFPYKKHMEVEMDSLLDQMIEEMKNAQDTLAYHGALKKISSALSDNHANLSFRRQLLSSYTYRTEAYVRYVEGQFVFYEPDVNGLVEIGDVLVEIKGKDVHVLADRTQRIGIQPDIYVAPSIKGMREGKDEVLEAAVKYIISGRTPNGKA